MDLVDKSPAEKQGVAKYREGNREQDVESDDDQDEREEHRRQPKDGDAGLAGVQGEHCREAATDEAKVEEDNEVRPKVSPAGHVVDIGNVEIGVPVDAIQRGHENASKKSLEGDAEGLNRDIGRRSGASLDHQR